MTNPALQTPATFAEIPMHELWAAADNLLFKDTPFRDVHLSKALVTASIGLRAITNCDVHIIHGGFQQFIVAIKAANEELDEDERVDEQVYTRNIEYFRIELVTFLNQHNNTMPSQANTHP